MNPEPLTQNPIPEPVQPVNQTPAKTNNLLVVILSVLLLIAVSTTAFLGYQNQQLTQKISEMEKEVTLSPSPVVDPTANWESYQIREVGLEFRLPPSLSSLGELEKLIHEGERGNEICYSFKGGAGGCLSELNQFVINLVSKDFVIGRESSFLDINGYTVKNDQFVYLMWGSEGALPQTLISEITNKNNIKILKIIGDDHKIDRGGDIVDFQIPGTPGKGALGAIINTPSAKYPGVTIRVRISEDLTSSTFDQILSTFRFIDLAEQRALEEKISLVSTSDWKRVKLEKISFLIPGNAKYEIVDNSQNKVVESCEKNCIGLINIPNSDGVFPAGPEITISTSKYEGGSRREQFWGGSTNKTICKPIYQEGVFGSINALQIAIDYEMCQGGGGGIVTILGDRFIVVGNLQRDPNNKSQILRFPPQDTIVSTLKLEN